MQTNFIFVLLSESALEFLSTIKEKFDREKKFKARSHCVRFEKKRKPISVPDWKNYTKKLRTAVREAGLSRHHGSLIERPLKLGTSRRRYSIKGYKGGPQLAAHYAERHEPLGQQG